MWPRPRRAEDRVVSVTTRCHGCGDVEVGVAGVSVTAVRGDHGRTTRFTIRFTCPSCAGRCREPADAWTARSLVAAGAPVTVVSGDHPAWRTRRVG